jgi:co-chaperonin GroES (HSP10)
MSSNVGQALNYNVIVQPVEVKNLTASGLDISSDVDKNEKYREGIIVSVGNLCPKDEKGKPYVKPGDKVSFDKYKATNYTKNAVEYLVLGFADLLLVQ